MKRFAHCLALVVLIHAGACSRLQDEETGPITRLAFSGPLIASRTTMVTAWEFPKNPLTDPALDDSRLSNDIRWGFRIFTNTSVGDSAVRSGEDFLQQLSSECRSERASSSPHWCSGNVSRIQQAFGPALYSQRSHRRLLLSQPERDGLCCRRQRPDSSAHPDVEGGVGSLRLHHVARSRIRSREETFLERTKYVSLKKIAFLSPSSIQHGVKLCSWSVA